MESTRTGQAAPSRPLAGFSARRSGRVRSPLGADTHAVPREAGFSDAQLHELRAAEVL